MTLSLVQLLRGFGPLETGTVDPPDSVSAPTVSAAVVAGNIVVTVAGDDGATNEILYRLSTGTTWSDGGSRVDDGTVTIAGPPVGTYYITAYSTLAGVNSSPGNMVSVFAGSLASIERALFTILTGDAGVAASVAARIYPQRAPQNTSIPYLTYHFIDKQRDHTVADRCGLTRARVQINCVDDKYADVVSLAGSVMTALDSYVGTVGTISIACIHIISETDLYVEPDELQVLKRYGKAIDIYIWYTE